MAGVPDNQLKPIGPWSAGIDNLHDETDLRSNEKGVRIALREAINVDITDAGKAQRRAGAGSDVIAGSNMHSGWHIDPFPFALYVDEDTLYGTTMGGASIPIRTGMAPRDVCYDLIGDRVYWTNGAQTGIVRANLVAQDLGVELPGAQPVLAATTAGGLDAGRYQVCVAFVRSDGEESGAWLAAFVDVPQGGGIQMSHVPQPVASDITAVRVFATLANGDVFYQCRDVPIGMPSASITPRVGPQCMTQFLEPMPPGRFITHGAGRLWIADRDLMWSEPMLYGLTNRSKNYIGFGGTTLCVFVGDGTDGAGIYVADRTRTYWLGGSDPYKAPKQIAYAFPAIPGSQCWVPGSRFPKFQTKQLLAYWVAQTESGGVPCVGLPGGIVEPIGEGHARTPSGASAASMFREQGGISQVLTAFRGGIPGGIAISDSAAATVNLNGVRR